MKIENICSMKAKARAAGRQALHEAAVLRLLDKNSEVTSMMVVAQSGLDVSVARRTLLDMESRGILICRVGTEARRSHYYSLAGEKPLLRSWGVSDNGVRLGQHQPPKTLTSFRDLANRHTS